LRKDFIRERRKVFINGYFVTLVYFWLNSVDLAGGHSIPESTIRRRYRSGILNLSSIYIPICNYWMIVDNTEYPSKLVAEGFQNTDKQVYRQDIYNQIIGQ